MKRDHLVFGWTMFLVFTILGLLLEALHGFKIGWYLDVGNETRRMMLRLAHVHGTLFGAVNILFAVTIGALSNSPAVTLLRASKMLRVGAILLPGGFLLGGLHIYDGDPGLGIVLAPIGALAFVASMALTVSLVRHNKA
ncbi:MAG: hypothetical protein CMH52_07535 [Myxococcales bacterium]|nr:hypothetical protein [Myxococcales bacterium]